MKMVSSLILVILTAKTSEEARKNITAALNERGIGEGKVNFRLRDWLISRQRYWGVPIPVVYCETCGEQLVPEEELPVRLPEDVKFESGAVSPLATSESFLHTTCPNVVVQHIVKQIHGYFHRLLLGTSCAIQMRKMTKLHSIKKLLTTG